MGLVWMVIYTWSSIFGQRLMEMLLDNEKDFRAKRDFLYKIMYRHENIGMTDTRGFTEPRLGIKPICIVTS